MVSVETVAKMLSPTSLVSVETITYVLEMTKGTKHEVYHGLKDQTAGGLTRDDLTKNDRGKVVSKRQSMLAKKNYHRLKKHCFKKK